MSRVHYERFRGGGPNVRTLPWVIAEPRSVGLVGHLFYYNRYENPWAKRRLAGWRVYAGGRSPDRRMNMKILWSAPPPIDGATLTVLGTRTVDRAHFSRTLEVGPSVLRIPRGCWRLSLRTRRTLTHLTVLAIAP